MVSTPKYIDDFVCNESSQIFSEPELALLNKGLNYTPMPYKNDCIETVIDIETAIKSKLYTAQSDIRESAREITL